MTPILLVVAAVAMQPVPDHVTSPAPEPTKAVVQPTPVLEAFPPGLIGVPGLPGAMTYADIPEGYVLVEGDIQMRESDYRDWLTGASTYGGGVDFWPSSGTIPYWFTANVDATNQQRAIDAMNAISARAGLFFTPRTNQDDYIRFNDSTFNNSPVGRQGGVQTINIASWGSQIVIIHEIYHSLGFHHEQSRPDRNTYVTIHLENVCQTCCDGPCDHNFEIRSSTTTYGFYDFDSFMHYRATDFSVNGQPTIEVNPPFTAQWQNAIGQRDHFSYFDTITCRGIYKFSFDRWWKPGALSNNFGNIINPLNHATFAAAYNAAPAGSVFFIKDNATYPAVGVYSKAMTINAPTGAILGN